MVLGASEGFASISYTIPIARISCLCLIAFDPCLIGHGALITNDIAATATGVLAVFALLFWLQNSSWKQTFLAGLCLALAELSKMSWLVLYGLIPMLAASYWLANRKKHSPVDNVSDEARIHSTPIAKIFVLFALSLYLINLGYIFDGSFENLGKHDFVSKAFTGAISGKIGNRFRGTIIDEFPVPLPEQYLLGLDTQKRDFEEFYHASYQAGTWQSGHGWWYYYLYGMLVKVPHVTQLVMLTGLGYFFYRLFCWLFKIPTRFDDSKATVPDLIVLITPALALFALVSSQDEFSIHFRYVFPCFPFFIILGCIALFDLFRSQRSRNILFAIVILSSLNNLRHFPHFIPYFNELSGGPANGWKHMLGSSYDWGQDMLFIKDYLEEHNIPIDEVRVKDHGYRYWECIYPDIWERQKGPFKYDLVSANVLTRPEKDYLKRLEAGEPTRICYTAWLFPIKEDLKTNVSPRN